MKPRMFPVVPVILVVAALAALAACSPAADQETSADAMAQASAEGSTRRVPQFENEHVEVWKSIILPNQPLEMHRHDNARAIVALKGGTLTVTNDAGESHDMTWETGSAYWLEADPPGELHGDVNEGPEPIEVIVVQLRDAS
jgi:quercetin dioxygenase-like cupin family protein